MMEEQDGGVEGDEEILASVFEAYSRQKSMDKKTMKISSPHASTIDHALCACPPRSAAKKPKENIGLKLKKYFASKLSETTTGQNLIQNYISERGQIIIKALCAVMLKFSGRDIARVMRRYVYKLATKFGILYTEKAMSEDKLNTAREPVLVMAFHLMRHLNREEAERADPGRITALKALITDAYEALLSLCVNVTGHSSTERLRVVYEYLTKGEFLNFFLCSPETEDEKRLICSTLELEMECVHGDAEAINRLYRQRLFQRKQILASLLGAPSLHLYINSQETTKLVIRWIAANGGASSIHRLRFVMDVDEYTKLKTRSLVARHGLGIYERYFSEQKASVLPVPSVIVEEIESKVHEEVFPINLFWDAYSAVLQSLEGLFMNYLDSQEFSILQVELRKLEKKLQVLARLSDISDECFMLLLANERKLVAASNSIKDDEMKINENDRSPKVPTVSTDISKPPRTATTPTTVEDSPSLEFSSIHVSFK